jgi:hypothetical protein
LAADIHRKNPGWASYRIVRAVCEDKSEKSVGGNIQFGLLDSDDFRVMGIHDYRVNDALKEIYTGFFIAGVEIAGGDSLFGDSGFALHRGFLNPFTAEIQDYHKKGYAGVASMKDWD